MRIRLLLLCCLLPLSLAAQYLTPESLWALGRVTMDDVSPDGKTVLYGVTRYQLAENRGNRNLFLLDVASGRVRQLTDLPGSESGGRFRPDGKRIGFLSGGQLWEISPDGSNARQVTDLPGGITGFAWSPRGDQLLMTREVKLDSTAAEQHPDLPKTSGRIIDGLMYRHWDSWHDYAYSHPFVAGYRDGALTGEPRDLMPGEPYDSPLMPFGGIEQLAWSPDGRQVVYTSKKRSGAAAAVSTNSDLYLADLAGGTVRNLTEGMAGYDLEPVFSPDGQRLAWTSMARDGFEADRNRLFVLDLASGEKTEISAGWEQDASHPRWSPDGKSIWFLSGVRATVQLFSVDLATRKPAALTEGRHDLTGFLPCKNGIAVSKMSMSEPVEICLVEPGSRSLKQLTFTNQQALAGIRMGKVEERLVPTTDGRELLAWVVYPPDFDPAKQYPALLYCQGGPQSTVSQFFSYRWNLQLMAANGYIVVAPNRRGLPSFGRLWNDQISSDWGGQAMDDLLSAIDHVAAEPYVNRDALGAVGASFGGFSVYWLAGNHEKRFKAFISHAGIFNFESWYGTTEELFFANWDMGGAYWEPSPNASYQVFSPHLYVHQWDTPILVMHGEKDYRVPVTEGMQAFTAAQLRGIPSRFLYLPDEGHWVMSPQNSLLWQRVFFEWLDQWLKKR